ncbi:glycoside hydrolase family 2 protein [Nonomuraea jabiensis]|uniref:glycoside hydrolase family 2 protein n=1 Tax=Nonomuraea jabiensis TaxID=882448 RepID=UPI003D710597
MTLVEGWRLRAVDGPVPESIAGREVDARVPGSTHLDLLEAGLIPDPYLDRNETLLSWMHHTDWCYSTTFQSTSARPGERVDLVFDGIDTVASVHFNGELLGHTANMHRGFRFDVAGLVRDGPNELVVNLRSALRHAEELEARLGRRQRAYPHPYNAIRKMACSFGWDWGPDLQTAGLWKPVRLERWDSARLAQVRPLVTVDEDGTGRVEVHVRLDRARDDAYTVVARVGGHEARTTASGESAVLTVLVPQARLWWPAGHGDQPLYELTVTLLDRDNPADEVRRRVGFRTITVHTEPDEVGTPFTFVVNGKPIFAKGANWIPDDHFLTRITRGRIAQRVDQAVGAHMNMLRVWGGGIYESDDFYDVCDERGILVWQDFPFACAFYAEEEPLWSEVEAEARENVARLTSHPSLALWCGNNENLVAYTDWPGWRDSLEGRTWGQAYYTELLPGIVAELDPTRPYAPGSPFSPGTLPPNDPDHGTRHEWAVWNVVDYVHYRDHIPRFCAEFGFQGPPASATVARWIHDEPLTPASPVFLQHQKAVNGDHNLDRGLRPHLPVPGTFADWHWATQLNQARAVALGVEHFRSWWPRTAGALVWQLNDCWPAISWSAVDYEGRAKPLYFALRHAFAPRLLTLQPRDGRWVLVAVNDHDEPWRTVATASRQTFDGEELAGRQLELAVPPRSVAPVELPGELLKPDDQTREVLTIVTGEGTRLCHLFAEDRDVAYDPRPLTGTVQPVDGGYRVEARATSFARDVALLADRVIPDAVVDEMLVSLPAGASHVFLVRTRSVLEWPDQLAAPEVLTSANGLSAVT